MGNVVQPLVNEPMFGVVHPVSRRPVVRTSNAGLARPSRQEDRAGVGLPLPGDDVFRLVKERFQAERSGMEFVDHEVFGDIHGHDELLDQLPSRLEEMGVDGTIVATGA